MPMSAPPWRLCRRDEVDWLGRVGAHIMSLRDQGVVPDIVTARWQVYHNGHPMAGGGHRDRRSPPPSPMAWNISPSAAIPCRQRSVLAVLDVIRDERLMQNAAAIGAHGCRIARPPRFAIGSSAMFAGGMGFSRVELVRSGDPGASRC